MPDDRGYAIGRVLGGGTVSTSMPTGATSLRIRSSVIDVSGASAGFDVRMTDRRVSASASIPPPGGSIMFGAAGRHVAEWSDVRAGGSCRSGGRVAQRCVRSGRAAASRRHSFPLNDHTIRVTAAAPRFCGDGRNRAGCVQQPCARFRADRCEERFRSPFLASNT